MKFINLEYHPTDSRIKIYDSDTCQTLTERMGTGGGNVPLIVEIKDDDYIREAKNTNRLKRSGGGGHELEL